VLDAMDGRFDVARAALGRSRDGLRDLGLNEAAISMAIFDAQAEMLAGNPAGARGALDEAEHLAAEIGDRWFQSTILVDRAHVVLAEAETAGERRAAVSRIDELPGPNDAEWCIKRHAARGKCAARDGDAATALMEARAAVELAERTEMFLFRADAWRDLAEVASRTGAADESERARATAIALYRAKGNVAAIERLCGAASR
jgi:ATP/maltotriose-dependent transcriptional regulator MalT